MTLVDVASSYAVVVSKYRSSGFSEGGFLGFLGGTLGQS